MQSHHSRLAKWASLDGNVSVLTMLAVSVYLSLSAVGIFLPQSAAAQETPPPQTQISFTYLRYNAAAAPAVTTDQSTFIRSGLASVSVIASFTGNGYNLVPPPPPSGFISFLESPQEASVSDGDAFIVTPIIDPDLNVLYTLHNQTGITLTSLTFTLQPTANLYFYDTQSTSGDALKQHQFSGSVGLTTFNNVTREGFRSLTFTGGGIANNVPNDFSFSLHVPDGTPGQGYAAVLSPNGLTPLAFPSTTAPEPGTLMLLLPVGMMLGAATRTKWRGRTP